MAKKTNYSFEKRAKEAAKQKKKEEKKLRKEENKSAAQRDLEQERLPEDDPPRPAEAAHIWR